MRFTPKFFSPNKFPSGRLSRPGVGIGLELGKPAFKLLLLPLGQRRHWLEGWAGFSTRMPEGDDFKRLAAHAVVDEVLRP